MTPIDLYSVLEIQREASPEVIRAAHKTLSRKYHPDRDSSPAAARTFAEVQRAYEILSDPIRRRQYDLNPDGLDGLTVEATAVIRVDGSSTFLTMAEHMRRDWQESTGCDLCNRDFSGMSFKNAKLAGAKLDGSRFIGCDFRGADLSNISAKRCQFDNVDFAGAKIVSADFSGCSIRSAKFFSVGPLWKSTASAKEIWFSEYDPSRQRVNTTAEEAVTVIDDTNFNDADLSKSKFGEAIKISEGTENAKSTFGALQMPRFWLRQSYLGCHLSKCTFTRTALIQCNFSGLNLNASIFHSANLSRADMIKCDLGGVNLSSANLLDANLTNCTYSDSTRFPDGFPVPTGTQNSDEVKRQTAAKAIEDQRIARKGWLIFITICVFLLMGLGFLIHVTTPAPPSFYARPSSGVATDGAFSAWQIPLDEWVPNPNDRSVIVEVSSSPQTGELPAGDLSIEISTYPAYEWETTAFVEQLQCVVLGNLGSYNRVLSFPRGVNQAFASVPLRVYNGRSQLRFFWPKENETRWRASIITFRLTSESLNSKGSVSVKSK